MTEKLRTWSTHTNINPPLLEGSKSGHQNFHMKKGTKRKEIEKTSTFHK